MRTNLNTNINISFGAIELKPKDREKSEILMTDIIKHKSVIDERNKPAIKLYGLFEKYIIEEARLKAKRRYNLEDVISDIKVKFWEFIYEIKSKATIDDLIKQIEEFKPNKLTLKFGITDKSLNTVIPKSKKGLHFIDVITKDRLPQPQSTAEKDDIKQNLDKAIKKTKMTSTTKKRLKQKSQGLSNSQIAKKEHVAKSSVDYSLKKGILQIQNNTNNISNENKQKISNLAKILGMNYEKTLDVALKQIELLYFKPETLSNSIEKKSELLGISKTDFTKLILKTPSLVQRKTETLKRNIDVSSNILGITKEDFTKIALKHPYWLYHKPETLSSNVEKITTLLKISKTDFVKAILKQPTLFYRRPEILDNNAEKTSALLGIKKEVFVKSALKQPSLFYQKPETIYENIKRSSALLEIPLTSFVKAALAQPSLFYHKPETIYEYIKRSSTLLEIPSTFFVKAALAQPSLFYQKPETIYGNIKRSAALLGTSQASFVKAALAQSALFYLKSENLNRNIETFAKMKGISKKEMLNSALKSPQLFYLKPETLYKKSQIANYYGKIKNMQKDFKVSYYINKSESSLYKGILVHLIFTNKIFDKLSKKQIEANLIELMNSCEESITLTVPKSEIAEKFIEYAKNFSIESTGKNIFKFAFAKLH